MSTEDDFSPIVARGEVTEPSGLRRFGRRGSAPIASESGVSRVFIRSDGEFISETTQSAGERYWGRLHGWVKVDISPHTLKFNMPVPDPSGRGDYLAHITVIAEITDPVAAAHAGPRGVRAFIEPVLAMKLGAIDMGDEERAKMSMPQLRADTTKRVRQGLAEQEQSLAGLPAGISARVASVTVTFDESTSTHLADLTEMTREGDLVDARHALDHKNTEHEIGTRKAWREAFGDLTDVQQGLLHLVASDPRPETIAHVVSQLAAEEASYRETFVGFLTQMIDKDFAERGDPLYDAAVSLLRSLQERAGIPMVESGQRPELTLASEAGEDSENQEPHLKFRQA